MDASKIIADGKPLDLKDGIFDFDSLSVSGPGATIESSNPGKITILGGTATLSWPQ
jgi:hypothetical protein